jgi:hypothetical protein
LIKEDNMSETCRKNGEVGFACFALIGKHQRKIKLERPKRRWQELREMACEAVN